MPRLAVARARAGATLVAAREARRCAAARTAALDLRSGPHSGTRSEVRYHRPELEPRRAVVGGEEDEAASGHGAVGRLRAGVADPRVHVVDRPRAGRGAVALPELEAGDHYERGTVLRKAGLFKEAIAEFEQAAASRDYTLKAHAQIGLCQKSRGRHEDAVTAFRRALKSQGSVKETVQILYVLGRTLETLGRTEETLEAYRWIRREDPEYRDVAERIRQLSGGRRAASRARSSQPSWVGGVLQSWQGLLRLSK